MTVEELVQAIEALSKGELRELVRRVPGLREAVEAEGARSGDLRPSSGDLRPSQQLAEVGVAYQVEAAEARKAPTPEERRAMSREELAARYKNPVQWTEHPWVVRVEGYKSGRPIILGTSIMVRTIVIAWVKHAMPIWDVLDNWPLHEAQVYDALSYYYDHREEIDADIRRHYDIEYWMRKYPPGKGEPA